MMLASHALVGRRGQGRSEMCEELAWNDARPGRVRGGRLCASISFSLAAPQPGSLSVLTLGFPCLAPLHPS